MALADPRRSSPPAPRRSPRGPWRTILLGSLVLPLLAAAPPVVEEDAGSPPPSAASTEALIVEGLDPAPELQPADSLGAGVESSRWWSREVGPIHERHAEHRLTRPLTPQRWLARWRRHHGCTAQRAKWAAPLESVKAPQLTFEGTCKGGDRYVIHLVQLGPVIHELHVDGSVLAVGELQLQEAMRALLARVRMR